MKTRRRREKNASRRMRGTRCFPRIRRGGGALLYLEERMSDGFLAGSRNTMESSLRAYGRIQHAGHQGRDHNTKTRTRGRAHHRTHNRTRDFMRYRRIRLRIYQGTADIHWRRAMDCEKGGNWRTDYGLRRSCIYGRITLRRDCG